MNHQEQLLRAQNRICELLKRKCKEEWETNQREINNIELGAWQGLYPDEPLRKARLQGENIGYEQVIIWLDSLLERGKKK